MSPDPVAAFAQIPYEVLFRSSPVPASLSRESDGRLLAVNDAWVALTGLARDAVIGRTTVELGHWLSEDDRQRYLRAVRDGAVEQEVVLRLGRVHHVRMLTTRLQTEPEPLLLVYLHDITAQREAEQALQKTNVALQQRLELYDALETVARVGHWTNAADDEQVYWSPGLRALAGLDPDMPLTREFVRSHIHPEDRAAWYEARQAMDGRTVEFRWQRPDDGQMLWLRTRMARTAVSGNPQTDFGVVQDVTAERQTARALAEQLSLMQNITARVPGMLHQARVRPDGSSSFTFLSGAAADMLELDPQALQQDGRLLFTRIHPDDREALVTALERSGSELTLCRALFRVQLPSKGQRWYKVDALPQREADGATLWYGFASDVTESRLAEQALQRQHRMLLAIQQSQAAFIESDNKREAFSALLDAFLAVTGSEYGFLAEVQYDMREQPYLRTHAISNIAWDEASRRAHDEQLESGMEFRNLDTLFGWALRHRETVIANDPATDPRSGGCPAGHRAMNAFMGIPLTVGDRLVGMVGLANQPGGFSEADVDFLQPLLGVTRQLVTAWRGHAERKRARLQFQATSALLAEKSAALQVTFDSMNQGLIQTDAGGRVRFYNRRVLEILDLPESLLAGQPLIANVVCFQSERGDFGDDYGLIDQSLRPYVGREPALMPPERYLRRTNDGRVLEIQTRVLAEGGMVRTYTDVTSYVEAQEQVRALNASLEQRVAERTAELERSLKDMEAISYSIAHDLRAPLRSVNGFASLIAEEEAGRLSPEARAMFNRINRSSANMGQMITDMLEMLRVVRVALEPAPVDMAALARRVIESLASETTRADVAVLSMPRVMGDATLLRQVLSNLLDNALKYSHHRERPELTLGYDEARLAFYLRDNGMGFDMARATKLFGLFQRLHAGGDVPGTGVGLAIVARIIERHNGRIWAESEPDVGTTFWWTLPLA